MKRKPPPHLVRPPQTFFRRVQREANYYWGSVSRAVLVQFLVCMAIVFVHAGLLYFSVLNPVQGLFVDYFFKLRPAVQTNPTLVYIEIAEDSLQAIGRWPWPRHYHAVLVHALKTFGAEAVVFDILFSEPSVPEEDGALAEAVQAYPGVYLPVVLEQKGDEKIWIHNLEPVEKNAKGTGHINISPDADGTLRRVQPFLEYNGERHPHLALKVAYELSGRSLKGPEDLTLPLDRQGGLMVNWAGRWKETYKHYSYVDVLKSFEAYTRGEKGEITPENIKGRICLVGLTAFGHADIKANPIEPAYPAVGIHGNLINSVLMGFFVHPPPFVWDMISLVALGLVASLLFLQVRHAAAFMTGLAVGLVWMVVAFFLFKTRGLVMDVAHPLIMILSLYVFSTVYVLVTGKKERLYLMRLASHDGLTGLYVIRHFRALLNKATAEAGKKEEPISLILLDIDHFKKINDTYGHVAGDLVLKETARVIKRFCRHNRRRDQRDVVGRYGGEEFIILLRKCEISNAFFKVAERLRIMIQEKPYYWEGKKIPVTISLGIATLRPGEEIPDMMVRRADAALYRAKREGRNRGCLESSDDDPGGPPA